VRRLSQYGDTVRWVLATMLDLKNRIASRKDKEIFALIRKQGIVSKTELMEQCGMTASTMTRALEELVRLGFIEEAGRGESTGGRRPILYRINPTGAFVFGLDISRTFSQLLLCDMSLRKIDSVTWVMSEMMTPDVLLRSIVETATAMMKKHFLEKSSILGMGIGSVGPLDRIRGIILEPAHFRAEGWRNVPITAYLEEKLDIPVVLDNGANAGIWAEYWADKPGSSYEHLLYIRAGVGLRSAMMSNGKLVYGAVDMEGSVGQMIIQTDGVRHRDRENCYGCLESYVSIYALEQQAISRLKQGRRSLLREIAPHPEAVDYSHLLRALEQNDPLTVEIFTQAATYFGIGLANLLNILHPEKVILGGPLITGSDLFFQTSTEVALRNAYYYPTYHVEFAKERQGEDTVAIGAAAMVINALAE